MTRGIRIRIAAFLVLSAVGIVYVAGTYLGLVDRLLGRGFTVEATLPTSGGLFEGSEVTYRGVGIGEVSRMRATREGVTLTLALEEGTRLPLDSPMHVHNLSAVGEQYLDFEPPDDQGPYADQGDVFTGDAAALPVDEGDLLVSLDDFVGSVEERDLQATVRELGALFRDTGVPLQRLLDDGGRFVREAAAHTEETIQLLRQGRTVLRTQQDEGENIRGFARDLALVTRALRRSDGDLRDVLQGAPGTAREVQALLRDLSPTVPVLLGNAISVNQVVVSHLAGIEQLLVILPRSIAAGFSGTSGGFGHVNLQFDYSVPPCTEGFKPRSEWRRGDQLSDGPIYPAECLSGPPYQMRGPKTSPDWGESSGSTRAYAGTAAALTGSYDPATGLATGAVDRHGRPVRFAEPDDLTVLGGDAWKWLLVGPVAAR